MNPPATSTHRSRPPQRRKSAAEALSGIWSLLLTTFVIGSAYFAREVVVPLALAVLLTFLLTPLVRWLDLRIKRIPAVILTVLMIVAIVVGTVWTVTSQVMDLAEKLPDYKENIRAKLHSIQMPSGGGFTRLSETLEDLKKDLPGGLGAETPASEEAPTGAQTPPPPPAAEEGMMDLWQSFAMPVIGPIGTAALVLLLVTFMLLKSEDLQSRFIRLAGQGRISSTTRALDDAGTRIRRYLLMQVVVNFTYGAVLAIGLYFIGVPNAPLWGGLAFVLRFIPYVGPWIAAAFPIVMSLSVGTSWTAPLLTIGFVVIIELLSNNVMEPLLYGSSTGVSAFALIVSAVFWTWLWGPAGLLLSTPLTVCLVVMGRHIPQLSFLSVLLSEEQALTPAEDIYHRMLRKGENEEGDVAEAFLKSNSLADLYDEVLIPVVIAAEEDYAAGMVDNEQRAEVYDSLRSLIHEIEAKSEPVASGEEHSDVCRILCLPARADRDVLAGEMVARVMREDGFDVSHAPDRGSVRELIGGLSENRPDILMISAVAPTTIDHVRRLCKRVRSVNPDQLIVVGLWGREGETDRLEGDLAPLGVEQVVTRISEAIAFCEGYAVRRAGEYIHAPVPPDEAQRLQSLKDHPLSSDRHTGMLETFLTKVAKIFEVPIAVVAAIGDRQMIRATAGMSEKPSPMTDADRGEALCSHVIAANHAVLFGDLLHDRRVANNPLVRTNGYRFYAGAPLRAADGQPIGTLCLLDNHPHPFSPSQLRQLQQHADELSRELNELEK